MKKKIIVLLLLLLIPVFCFAFDPTTEIDLDLVCDATPDWNPAAGATVMDVLDTTTGAATADTGFDSATCANGNRVYLRFGADPVDSGEIVRFKLQYFKNED